LERAKLTPLKLENSSCCTGLKQFQFFRSASPRTIEQKAQTNEWEVLKRCSEQFLGRHSPTGVSLRVSNSKTILAPLAALQHGSKSRLTERMLSFFTGYS
jgi:hypothetical protein